MDYIGCCIDPGYTAPNHQSKMNLSETGMEIMKLKHGWGSSWGIHTPSVDGCNGGWVLAWQRGV